MHIDFINDAMCNAPTVFNLVVVADGVTYRESIRVLDDEYMTIVDRWWVQCYEPMKPSVSVVDSAASESGGDVTFVVNVSPALVRALDSQGPAVAHDVRVDYSTAPYSASDGADYRGVTGTLTIPSGTGLATISVPLVDDSVTEGDESFELHLNGAVGAGVAHGRASATIFDDDLSLTVPPAHAVVCEGASLSGSVGDVFDVAQTGFAPWSHVFIDVELSCGEA